MELTIFSIYDQKAKAFLPPFFLPRVEMAERTFSDCANDPSHNFGKHPEDYVLHRIGVFDDQDGKVSVLPTPEVIGSAMKYKVKRSNGLEDPAKFEEGQLPV